MIHIIKMNISSMETNYIKTCNKNKEMWEKAKRKISSPRSLRSPRDDKTSKKWRRAKKNLSSPRDYDLDDESYKNYGEVIKQLSTPNGIKCGSNCCNQKDPVNMELIVRDRIKKRKKLIYKSRSFDDLQLEKLNLKTPKKNIPNKKFSKLYSPFTPRINSVLGIQNCGDKKDNENFLENIQIHQISSINFDIEYIKKKCSLNKCVKDATVRCSKCKIKICNNRTCSISCDSCNFYFCADCVRFSDAIYHYNDIDQNICLYCSSFLFN